MIPGLPCRRSHLQPTLLSVLSPGFMSSVCLWLIWGTYYKIRMQFHALCRWILSWLSTVREIFLSTYSWGPYPTLFEYVCIGLFIGLFILFHYSTFLCYCQPVFITTTLEQNLKSKHTTPSILFFFFKIAFRFRVQCGVIQILEFFFCFC